MADRLYLSAWLRSSGAFALQTAYRKLIEAFPHSKLSQREAVFRIHAVAHTEPLLLEVALKSPPDPQAVMDAIRDFQGDDVCYELETAWDLWACEPEWKLAPARVTLAAYAPDFERDSDAQIRIDFGLDDQFLPESSDSQGLAMIRANIQSLLHLSHDLDERLKPGKRQLWSESGIPFTAKLETALKN